MEDLPKVETERPSVEHIPGGIVDDQEEEEILRLVSWIEEQDLPEPELMYELADRNTNETVAVLDVAWPKGLQTGLSSPVCLLLADSANLTVTDEVIHSASALAPAILQGFNGYIESNLVPVLEAISHRLGGCVDGNRNPIYVVLLHPTGERRS